MRLLKYTDGSLNVSWYYIFQSRWLQATLPNCWSFTSTLEVYCCPKCFFQNICILQTRFGPHFSIASCPGGQRRSTSLRVGVLTRSMRTQPPQFAWVSQHIYIFTFNWKILEYLVISRAQVENQPWGPPWTLETPADPWRPLATCMKMANFPQNGQFQECRQGSPRVAKGCQSPRGTPGMVEMS